MTDNTIELTILMPCLDEAETLATCIQKAQNFIQESGVKAEILIADNGSTDGSQEISRQNGARVINVTKKGYGNALISGIKAAKGKYVIMGDADDSYDFLALQPFLKQLRAGFNLVMGNRFLGGIKKKAMPPLHRYLGNPVLSFIGKLFFKIKVGDFHCGLRGFNRQSILDLNLICGGMEFASEMVVKASLHNVSMTEVPTTLSPDGRSRPPHLRSWRDGWRHLRFLLIFSPRWLFLYPGITLLSLGAIGMLLLLSGPLTISTLTFDIHTMLFMAAAITTGTQLISFSVLGRILGIRQNLLPEQPLLGKISAYFSMEKVLIAGLLMLMLGAAYTFFSITDWQQAKFGALDPTATMRKVILSMTLVICGIQVFFSAFFTGLIDSFSNK
ncbi:MAG: glycosyltransferase family 2 protein [Arenicella sp.]